MATHVLLIGSGGREHALAWKLSQSPRLGSLFIAPGNGGTATVGENVPIEATDIDALLAFARARKVGLTIVGPDDPLALGIVDRFQEAGLRIFGPTKSAARVEWSKAFAKELMREARIPTAASAAFSDYPSALAYLRQGAVPTVVKASGLALGKGAFVCKTLDEAESALRGLMVERICGDAGAEVVIEEYLEGRELSIHAIADGRSYAVFPAAQDHKRAFEGDQGPNTGGMGTIAPVPWVTAEMRADIDEKIVRPALDAIAARCGAPFTGVLFPGIMMTAEGPKVLEFNARFGDPETQAYMRLMDTDLLELLVACTEGALASVPLRWKSGAAANVVLASGGYPGPYAKGHRISGLDEAGRVPDAVVFHAGTVRSGDVVSTSGGRVLGASAIGQSVRDALAHAYAAAEAIHFDGAFMRRDIGAKSL